MTTQLERLTAVETELKALRDNFAAFKDKDFAELRADVRTLLQRESERRGASKFIKALYGIGVAVLGLLMGFVGARLK